MFSLRTVFPLTLTALFIAACQAQQTIPSVMDMSATSTPQATVVPSASPTVTPTPLPTPDGQSGAWTLIFQDEFDGNALDTNKWYPCYWWDKQGCTIVSNNELEWYQPDDVLVSNGLLRLRARPRVIEASNGKTYEYTSGMVSSGRGSSNLSAPAGLVFQYGYAEIRAKLPAGRGLWPAFWLLPNNNTSKPEIDVLEVLGHAPDTTHMAFHYRLPDGEDGREKATWQGSDFSADWHTFAIDWQPDKLVWYIDGVERWRYTDVTYIPSVPMYLLINLAVGGDWPGIPDENTTFPAYYEIDYVRVWSR
jgi:beta-glucanase (GH16 family)